MNKYSRTQNPVTQTVGTESMFPLKFTDQKSLAVRNFQECYEKILKPKQKYRFVYNEEAEAFFGGGVYDLLIKLE